MSTTQAADGQAVAGPVELRVRPLVAWVTERGREVLQAGDGPARAMPMQDEETGFTVPLYSSAALRGMKDALQRINDWCCYATEEDVNARLLALQQIGQTAREALAQVDRAAWVELHRDAWNDGRAA